MIRFSRRLGQQSVARYGACLSAVISISIFMRGSASPALIIIAAGRTSPKCFCSTGQHCSNSISRNGGFDSLPERAHWSRASFDRNA